jgi:hypothetical protein
MSESSEHEPKTAPVAAQVQPTPPPPYPAAPAPVVRDDRNLERRPNRVSSVAAWVGIVAGVVFIVAVIFFSGFILGRATGGGMHHRGPDGGGQFREHMRPPPMGPFGGPGWPGFGGPGGPGAFGPPPGPGGPAGPGGPGGPNAGPQPPQPPGAPSSAPSPRPS